MSTSLVDAARLARWLLGENPDLLKSPAPGDPWRVNVERLRQITERKIGRSIEVRLAEDPGNMNGLVLDLSDTAVILVAQRHSENTCWIRMTMAKELLHLYTQRMLNGRTNLNVDLIAARDCRVTLPSIRGDMHDEAFCFFAALELLLPPHWRGDISDARHRNGLTNYQIACRCRVPQSIIEFYFDRGYGETSVKANQET